MQAHYSEQAVLGCLLLEPTKFATANQILSPDDFYSEIHQRLFKTFAYYHSLGANADFVLIRDRFKELDYDFDYEYISSLSDCPPISLNLINYCKSVKEASLKRSYQRLLRKCQDDLKDIELIEKTLTKDLVASLMKEALKIDILHDTKYSISEAVDLFKQSIIKGFKLLSLGFDELDKVCNGGINTHGLVVIVSDSGVGKTTMTSNMLVNKALLGEKVLYVNLEIPIIDMIEIIAPQLSDEELSLDYKKLITASVDDLEAISDFMKDRLECLGIYFAKNCYKLEEIIAQMDLHRIDYGVQSCFIDHVQLIEGSEDYTRYVGITKEFKRYCLRHEMPIFLLCQTNDNKEKRMDKDPRKSDLRGGANLFQDADIVLFLYKLDPEDKTVYLKVAKNRKGTTGQAIYFEIDFNYSTRRIELNLLAQKPFKETQEDGRRKKRTRKIYDSED